MSIKGSNESPIQRVLVIDDNKDTTELLEDFFESEDIECIVINEGRKGLEEIRKDKGHYDLILLDLTIPEFSGWDIFVSLFESAAFEMHDEYIALTDSNGTKYKLYIVSY